MWEGRVLHLPWGSLNGVQVSGWFAPSQTLRRCGLFSRLTDVKKQLHILLVIVLRKQVLSCVAFLYRLTAEGVCVCT